MNKPKAPAKRCSVCREILDDGPSHVTSTGLSLCRDCYHKHIWRGDCNNQCER